MCFGLTYSYFGWVDFHNKKLVSGPENLRRSQMGWARPLFVYAFAHFLIICISSYAHAKNWLVIFTMWFSSSIALVLSFVAFCKNCSILKRITFLKSSHHTECESSIKFFCNRFLSFSQLRTSQFLSTRKWKYNIFAWRM